MLDGAGTMWQIYIEKEIQNCDACARNIGRLAVDLAKASGDSGEINKQNAKEVFYATVDRIFREWLYELDPDEHEENYIDLLRKQVKNIVKILKKVKVKVIMNLHMIIKKRVIKKKKRKF